ncbi:hypothetical protein BS78_09G085900 [Paspalum vaginatum]|nr:hypothetical protein BS78_09G085900 [Paspalum vaginatum]
MLTKIPEFQCETHDMKVWVERSDLEIGSFGELSQTWVQLRGVPQWARKEGVVEELSFLVGDCVEIDKNSVTRMGPIRLKVACKDPNEIGGVTKIFMNGMGFKLSWLVEIDKHKVEAGLRDGGKFREHDREDEDDDEEYDLDEYNPVADQIQKLYGMESGGASHT